MISDYKRSLFEQQTPYLQWLKEREENTGKNIKGKQIIKLPFLSCEESLQECFERAEINVEDISAVLEGIDFILFYGANGIVHSCADAFFAEYFDTHAEEVIVYADEDYLGSLQDLYGERVKENEIATEYLYEDTRLYRGMPWFKPDYSPDTLRSFFYYGNIFAVRSETLRKFIKNLKKMEREMQKCSIYEFALRLSERLKHAGHIEEVLYSNYDIQEKDRLCGAGKNMCQMKENLFDMIKMQEKMKVNIKTYGTHDKNASNHSIVNKKQTIQALYYEVKKKSLVSIVIPSKDNSEILKRCLLTLIELTNYPHYEIIIVDNGSTKEQQMCIKKCIEQVQEDYDLKWADDARPIDMLSIQYIYQKTEFNFSAMCNMGARAAKGEYILFLNDDIETIQPDWLKILLGQASCSHTGAVGAKLYYPKKEDEHEKVFRIQHVGITNMGIGPAHKLAGKTDEGNLYHGHNLITYNMLAVTGACLMIRKKCFMEVGGFDEELAVAYNDVELCFRLYEKGYYNVQRNDVILLHHESLTRGQDTSPQKVARLEKEKAALYKKHPLLMSQDPFYSKNLVQWKKDSEYHCEYLYAFDKKISPERLVAKEAKKLPKVHENKLLCKVTGENRMMLVIDALDDEQKDATIRVQGWFVLREQDNARLEKRLLFKNIQSGDIYQLAFCSKLRYDVEDLFEKQSEKKKSATKNTALAGVDVLVDKNMLTNGTYQIGMLAVEEKTLNKRKICWKKDCTFTINHDV